MSDNFNTSPQPSVFEVDGRWKGPRGDVIVEVKKTSSVRDVRDVFLELAYLLSAEPKSSQAVCVLDESRLSESRLHEELLRFRSVVQQSTANRMHFLVAKTTSKSNAAAFGGSIQDAPLAFYEWLAELVENERLSGHQPQLPARQLVVAALAQLRLWNEPPVTIKSLQEACRVSYPTVAAVLKTMAEKGLLEDSGERGVRLRPLISGEWMSLAREHAQHRSVRLFVDPSGQALPEELAKRLVQLQDQGKVPRSARVGGVIGASRHFPELDITGAPRLDLSVETDPAGIAAVLDAGLIRKTRSDQRVAVAVHLTRNPQVITGIGPGRHEQWAGELECLADLIEIGYTREAAEMAHHMELTSKKSRSDA